MHVLPLLLALFTSAEPVAVVDRVDLIEVNHFYDENGKHIFDQIIYYDWCDETCRFQVRAWRLLKSPNQVPRRVSGGGGFASTFADGDYLRRVEAPCMRETWSQQDPELRERTYLPREARRELSRPHFSDSPLK